MQIASMTAQEAKDLLRHCLEDGVVMRSDHFVEELASESFTDLDIENCLRYGNIWKPAEQDIKTGDWKYRIEHKTADGQGIAILFCFKSLDRARLITVFSQRG